MSRKAWRQIRVPADLAERLDALAAKERELWVQSIKERPADLDQRGDLECPLWHVIRLPLDELEDHRERSRTKRRSESAGVKLVERESREALAGLESRPDHAEAAA